MVKGEDDVSIVMQFSDQMRVVESVYVGKIDDKGYAQCSCLTNEYTNLTAGIMIFERGNGLYIGGWNKGRYHGFGRYEETNGVSYEGGWKDGLMHGHGKFTWPQHGGIFLGEFDKDKRI